MSLVLITNGKTGAESAQIILQNDEEAKAEGAISRIAAGMNMFTFSGYVSSATGAPAVETNYKHTNYIPFDGSFDLVLTGVSYGGLFRQVAFYSAASVAGYISSFTANNNTSLTLNAANIPAGTKFIILNAAVANVPTITFLRVNTAGTLDIKNKSPKWDVDAGLNVFTNSGYINLTTGKPAVDASYKYSQFLPLMGSQELVATALSIGGAFRQAAFYSDATFDAYLSSYTADNNAAVTLNAANVPAGTKFVVLNSAVANIPSISYSAVLPFLKPIAPSGIDLAAWGTISPTTGYSSTYGRYRDLIQWNLSNDFCGLIYPVVAGKTIRVRGSFYGNNAPIVVFFSDATLTTFVANGVKRGGTSIAYADFTELVPAGATFALVQQFHGTQNGITAQAPFPEIVVSSSTPVPPKRVIIVGDSFTQMGGYYNELMLRIKTVRPEYEVYNYGIGGEKTLEISARLGAFATILSPPDANTTVDSATGQRYFTIPADASTVNIGAGSILNGWDNTALALLLQTTIMSGCAPHFISVEGVLCRLTYSAPNYFIQRAVAGSAVKVFKGATIYYTNAPAVGPDDIFILNMGQNGGYTDTADFIAQQKRMVELLNTTKIVILSSHFADTSTPASINYITKVVEREAALLKAFGNKYLNMRAYFRTQAVTDALASGFWNTGTYPTDVGGETHPSAADTAAMTAGTFAPMFWCNPNNSADIIHMARRTYAIRDAYIFKRIQDLKYLE